VSFTNHRVRVGLASLGLLAGCSAPPPPAPSGGGRAPATAPVASPSPAVAPAGLPLPPPGPVRSWAEVRLQAAHRLIAANPGGTPM
jgi:hypothetical protein